MSVTRTCSTCRFWQPKHDASGECRVHAPQLDQRGEQRLAIGLWPLTDRSEWCGEWFHQVDAE